jgi:predicted dinucleotide-binding enzyme
MLGSRDPKKLEPWMAGNPAGRIGTFAETAGFGELLVLAVKGGATGDVLRAAGAENLSGKTVIDATNPIDDLPPENGVLRFYTDLSESLMERLQTEFADARFVKAFNSVGNRLMVNPTLEGGPPSMFICGNDRDAKAAVTGILEQFGWEAEDMGGVESARAIEPLCMLWCVRGFLRNEWNHAFKLLK